MMGRLIYQGRGGSAYRERQQKRASINRREALTLLPLIEQECSKPHPALVKLKKPQNWLHLNRRMRERWEIKAFHLLLDQSKALFEILREDHILYKKLVSQGCQSKYRRAAKAMLDNRNKRLRDAGWLLF